MVQDMLDSTLKVKKKEKVLFTGSMDLNMKDNSITIPFTDMESTNGLMVENMLETGKIIKCMEKVINH
jgi:hypothetical protein